MQRLRRKPKWVTGLKPKIEELFEGRTIGEGLLIGSAIIHRDMVKVTQLKFSRGRVKKPIFEIDGNELKFIYPLKNGENAEKIYYYLIGFLSNV
jgi:mannitol/fructose-specific phosphotransferase system IIA component (Ntr-type)